MSMRSARRRSFTFESCDAFGEYWQRTRLRPLHVRWWAQDWTTPTQFCIVLGTNIHKLQRMQHTIAQVVKLSRSNTGVMDILKDLHWLLVQFRIDFKIVTLVYKVRSSSQPVYLLSLISDYALIRSLCATGTHILHTLLMLSTLVHLLSCHRRQSLEHSSSWHQRMHHTIDFSL